MRRICFLLILCLLLGIGVAAAELPEAVVAVGRPAGIEVECGGLLVVGFTDSSPARDCGLRKGDLIESVDGQAVREPGVLREILQGRSQVTLTALREGRVRSFLIPLTESGGVQMLGVTVRRSMGGIGTITYYDPDTRVFGALGHGVAEENGALFPLKGGLLLGATILRVEKGKPGAPGMLLGDPGAPLGTITVNCPWGVFGHLEALPSGQMLPVAGRSEVTPGPAQVLLCVSGGEAERYEVEIARVFSPEGSDGRDLMLRVTDPRLLSATGGIVQGMSGSPILQDGKIVGAVTHVLVADPQVGYGIFIDRMLTAAQAA